MEQKPEWVTNTLLVGLGGFLGANARYWLGLWITGRWGAHFPWGTFVINVTGSFVLGLLLEYLAERTDLSAGPTLRLLIAVGFLGAYTTFSTYEYDNLQLLMAGQWQRALANAAGSLVVGLVAAGLGVALGRAL